MCYWQIYRSFDGLKTAEEKLRKSLISFEFELYDKFCDSEEFREAWENISMSHEFLTCFAELFSIKKTNLITDIGKNPEFSNDSDQGRLTFKI